MALDSFRRLGISPLDATWHLTIQLGRVTTFIFAFTPAATARLQAALVGGGAASGGGGAAAGGGGTGAQTAAPTASAGRSLALTGADTSLVGVAMASMALGSVLLFTGRRGRIRA